MATFDPTIQFVVTVQTLGPSTHRDSTRAFLRAIGADFNNQHVKLYWMRYQRPYIVYLLTASNLIGANWNDRAVRARVIGLANNLLNINFAFPATIPPPAMVQLVRRLLAQVKNHEDKRIAHAARVTRARALQQQAQNALGNPRRKSLQYQIVFYLG